MNESHAPEHLNEQAAARAAAVSAWGAARSEKEPAPGDVILLSDAKDLPVQWLILARDPSMPRKLLLAVLDSNPMLGSNDLEIEDKSLGHIVLRRPYGGWLDCEKADRNLRIGSLSEIDVAKAREHWFRNAPQRQSILMEETDLDPEYQYWLKTIIEPSCKKVFSSRGHEKSKLLLPLAVAILSLLVGAQLWTSRQLSIDLQELRSTRDTLAARERELENENSELAESVQQLTNSMSEKKGELMELNEELTMAEFASKTSASKLNSSRREVEDLREELRRVGNVPKGFGNLVTVPVFESRASSNELLLEPHVESILLKFLIPPDLNESDFIARFSQQKDETLWESSVLSPDGTEVWVLVPRDFLSEGVYSVHLAPLDGSVRLRFQLIVKKGSR